ncbi:hypothetical protein LTR53_012566, partial [Teratosphaeriaceae sp. CCFEE 6253]
SMNLSICLYCCLALWSSICRAEGVNHSATAASPAASTSDGGPGTFRASIPVYSTTVGHPAQGQITAPPLTAARVGIGVAFAGNTNATFRTSCGWNESACFSICQRHANECPESWSQFSSSGISYSYAQWETSTATWTLYTQKTELVSGYTYAMGSRTYLSTTKRTISDVRWHPVAVSTILPTPTCEMPAFKCTLEARCIPSGCTVQGGEVELLYWPADSRTLGANSTGQRFNGSGTATPSPVTALYKNVTLTSPSAYIDFKTAFALDNCGKTVGRAYPGAIISLDPKDLYTIQADFDYFVVTTTMHSSIDTTTFYQSAPMDYKDLTGLPPGAAYQAMPICVADGCDIISPSSFHPQLVLPTQVRDLDPAWRTCGLDWQGLWDPPIVLTPQGAAATVTRPSTMATTAAAPQTNSEQPARQTGVSMSSSLDSSEPVAGAFQASVSHANPGPAALSSTGVAGIEAMTPSSQAAPAAPSSGSDAIDTPSTYTPGAATSVSEPSLPGDPAVDPEISSADSAVVVSSTPSTAALLPSYSVLDAVPDPSPVSATDGTIGGDPSASAELSDASAVILPTPSAPNAEPATPDPGSSLAGGPAPSNALQVLTQAQQAGSAHLASSDPGDGSHAGSPADSSASDANSDPNATTPPSQSARVSRTMEGTVAPLSHPSVVSAHAPPTFSDASRLRPQESSTAVPPSASPSLASAGVGSTNPSVSSTAQTQAEAVVLTFESTTLTAVPVPASAPAGSQAWIVASGTLMPGDSAKTLDGHALSAGAGGILLDGSLAVSTASILLPVLGISSGDNGASDDGPTRSSVFLPAIATAGATPTTTSTTGHTVVGNAATGASTTASGAARTVARPASLGLWMAWSAAGLALAFHCAGGI